MRYNRRLPDDWRRLAMRKVLLILGCIALAWTIGLRADAPGAAPPTPIVSQADGAHLFADRVWPVIQEKCLACHGNDAKKIKGGLDLRTREAMLKGGESDKPAIIPGDFAKSPLYVAVTRKDPDLAMPPKENDRLSDEQVKWMGQWIAAGAPWPDLSKPLPKVEGKW